MELHPQAVSAQNKCVPPLHPGWLWTSVAMSRIPSRIWTCPAAQDFSSELPGGQSAQGGGINPVWLLVLCSFPRISSMSQITVSSGFDVWFSHIFTHSSHILTDLVKGCKGNIIYRNNITPRIAVMAQNCTSYKY